MAASVPPYTLLLLFLFSLFFFVYTIPRSIQPTFSQTKNHTTIPLVLNTNLTHIGHYASAAYKRFTSWNSCRVCQEPDISSTEVNHTWTAILPSASKGYVGVNHQTREIIVAYRGTTHPLDMLSDIEAIQFQWPHSQPSSYVHLGFLSSYTVSKVHIHEAIDRLVEDFPEYKVYITGHSFGGALATLCFAEYAERSGANVSLVTFGSPRVGNSAFANVVKELGAVKVRTVHEADLIPHLPSVGMGYFHVDVEVWIIGDEIRVCEMGEDPGCSARVAVGERNLWDHMRYPGIEIGIPDYFE